MVITLLSKSSCGAAPIPHWVGMSEREISRAGNESCLAERGLVWCHGGLIMLRLTLFSRKPTRWATGI